MRQIFLDPVFAADGNIYERKAIEVWLENNDTSPISDSKIGDKQIKPNVPLRKEIQNYFEEKRNEKEKKEEKEDSSCLII